ncbi:TPA: hypothetical protein SMF84_002831 [Serratia marcescens]|uniref:hypothetical protein n=1 Tax=Serratia ureilytica TaxID=300181 RepID=UPI0029E2DF62|nr:hypothetical protein [Serratia marcescens]HEJ7183842.1 hypothetical protein [Serratia marcescens]HEJ7213167.1 hypothetical protein [Serratia marcescens]HEJ9172046.1 hypothetical protein [Serratia marcescens]
MMTSFIDNPIEIRLLNTADVNDLMSLSYRMDNINGNTLVLENGQDIDYWHLEEYRNTCTYYLLAEGDIDAEYCLTAYESHSHWQPVVLEPRLDGERRQLWRIINHPNGHYVINNLKYLDKYLSHLPIDSLSDDQKRVMISPPQEVIGMGEVMMHWYFVPKEGADGVSE